MISFISISKFWGLIPALPNRSDPVRFEVVDNQRTSHGFKINLWAAEFGAQGGSPTVREGSPPVNEPSLTVGLLPDPRRNRLCVLALLHSKLL